MANDRLKKNISFSEHERDIYEYLNTKKNASAFIKNLIRREMFLEEMNMTSSISNIATKKKTVEINETSEVEEKKQPKVKETTKKDDKNILEVKLEELGLTKGEMLTLGILEKDILEGKVTEEYIENRRYNIQLVKGLDL